MHPSCALIIWLAAVLALPALGYGGALLLAGGLLLLGGGVRRAWAGYVRRSRWLLLTLWLILAYNVPGEAFLDYSWAPTYEGITDANRQALRLITMLGCVACLFDRLGRDGLVGALWGLLQPLRALGLATERLVVRLSLVLANLQESQAKGAWRQMLGQRLAPDAGPDVLHVALPAWAVRDSLLTALAGGGLLAVLVA